jgi:hypothetical protein
MKYHEAVPGKTENPRKVSSVEFHSSSLNFTLPFTYVELPDKTNIGADTLHVLFYICVWAARGPIVISIKIPPMQFYLEIWSP